MMVFTEVEPVIVSFFVPVVICSIELSPSVEPFIPLEVVPDSKSEIIIVLAPL